MLSIKKIQKKAFNFKKSRRIWLNSEILIQTEKFNACSKIIIVKHKEQKRKRTMQIDSLVLHIYC